MHGYYLQLRYGELVAISHTAEAGCHEHLKHRGYGHADTHTQESVAAVAEDSHSEKQGVVHQFDAKKTLRVATRQGDILYRQEDGAGVHSQCRHLHHRQYGQELAAIKHRQQNGHGKDKEHEHRRNKMQRHFYLLVDREVELATQFAYRRQARIVVGLHSREHGAYIGEYHYVCGVVQTYGVYAVYITNICSYSHLYPTACHAGYDKRYAEFQEAETFAQQRPAEVETKRIGSQRIAHNDDGLQQYNEQQRRYDAFAAEEIVDRYGHEEGHNHSVD